MKKLSLLALVLMACVTVIEESYEVVPQQIGEVWVFAYSEPPLSWNDALNTGEALVVDGCLEVGGAVVIWHQDQLGTVEEAITRLEQGEILSLQVGGGGLSLSEGSTVEDFPAEVLEHCSATAVWFSSREAATIVDDI